MKSSRLKRSNAAHKRLQNKYDYLPGKKAEINFRYHLRVSVLQSNSGRVLSRAERSKIYKTISDKVYSR